MFASSRAERVRLGESLGIVIEDDHDPSVAQGVFEPRDTHSPSGTEREVLCRSWERFDRAYRRVGSKMREVALQRIGDVFGELRYEDLAASHRFILDDRLVVSCDDALWQRLTRERPRSA